MGKEKYLKAVEELFRKSPIVSSSSIAKIVKNKLYTKQLIRNLILKGKIQRLTKGYYTAHDDPSLIVYCFKPSYLGLQDALSYHNLWEQETIPIIITTRKIRSGIRNILGVNVLIRRLQKKYFFGIEYDPKGFYQPYSDTEKTFLDLVYFREMLSDETRRTIINKIDKKKLYTYLKVYSRKMKRRVEKYLQ